jgi:hypothetical protein
MPNRPIRSKSISDPFRVIRFWSASSAFAVALLLSAPAHSQPGSILVWFATPDDTSQIFYNEEPRFLVVVETPSPDSSVLDTLSVVVATEQGDRETVKAAETAPASGRFIAEVNLRGVYDEPLSGNGFLEIDGNSMNGETIVMDATVEVGDVSEIASLDLGFPGADAIQPKARVTRRRPATTGAEAYTIDGRMLPRGMRSLPPGSFFISP